MKLGELERLLARLALKMQSPQLNQLRFSCSELTEAQKMEAQSPIKLFTILKRKSKSNEQFVSTLEQHFEGIQDFEDLSTIVQDFRSENPDPNSIKPLKGPILPNGAFAFRPGREQSHYFKRMLLNVSNSLNWIHLEIMVAISPIPDSLKEHMNKGYQLFEELKRHGCISENDTEFLDDVFTLLNLQAPLQLLQSYQRQYPQTIFPEPSPSAPTFATPPSSLQASYSSPSEGSPSFLSLPTHYSPVETSGIGGLSPHQPPSLPHQVSTYPQTTPHAHWQHGTYPRPPQTTSPQSRTQWQHQTYPRPPQTTSPQPQRNTYPQTIATSGTSSSLHPNQQPVQATTTRCSSPGIPYPTTRSLEERRKRQREGDQLPDPSEEQLPAVKRTRDIDSLSTPSRSSRASTSQLTSSLGSSSSSLSYQAHHEFPSAISESGSSGQEGGFPERERLKQTGHLLFSESNRSRSVLSRTEATVSHHNTHSVSHLTDKEQLAYSVCRPEGHSTEESGEGGPERFLSPHGSLPPQNITSASSIYTRPNVHGTPPPRSMNLEAKSHLTEESGAGETRKLVGTHGSLPSSNGTPNRHVLTRSEAHATPSLNLPVEQQPSIRPPSDVHPGPDIPHYAHAHEEQSEETYTEPTESTAGENGELTFCRHQSSSGNSVHQASSQSNVAFENSYPPVLQSYVHQPRYQPYLSSRKEQFVASVQPPSFSSSSGSSLVTGTSYYPTGTSLATSDLLSSESGDSSSSYQGSTMPSQPSFEPSLSSVEEEKEEREEEEEEETCLKRPKLARSASSTKRRKSSPPSEEQEDQRKSWTSSFFSLPKKVVSRVWSTFSGGTQEKKEEDSDNSFESCKDDEGSSSD